MRKYTKEKENLVATYYVIKWVEARILKINTTIVITNFCMNAY